MKWIVDKAVSICSIDVLYENGDHQSILWGDTNLTSQDTEEILNRVVLEHNFCEDFSNEELQQMQSLRSFQILTKAYSEGVLGMLEDVRDDSVAQVRLLQRLYIDLCDIVAMEDERPHLINNALGKIESYAYKKDINLNDP